MHCTGVHGCRHPATTSHISSGFIAIASALFLTAASLACSGDSPAGAPAVPTSSALFAAVTGPAADAIGANGQIQFAPPSPGDEKELTASEAVDLASSWTSERAPMTRSWLERTHGAAINFKALHNCGRALYARSAFNAAPQNIPGPFRRGHGPWWLVTFCDVAGSPSVSIAVSAWANDLTVEAGRIYFPRVSGTEFVAIGIPVGHVGEYPMPPETAVEMAAKQAGKRIAKVPELVTPLPSDGPPQLARWRLVLEAPISAHTESGEYTTNEVFVGPTIVGEANVATSVAAAEQPETIDMSWTPAPRDGERRESYSTRAIIQIFKVLRRQDTPVRFESVTAWGN